MLVSQSRHRILNKHADMGHGGSAISPQFTNQDDEGTASSVFLYVMKYIDWPEPVQ